jgi:hypothetical protein
MHGDQHVPSGPFGYATCGGCGVAVQRRLMLAGHACEPDRYAAYQARKLAWSFEDALHRWLETSSGRFAQYNARRLLGRERPSRVGGG